jgi:thiamine-monophosphate kinase
LEFLLEPNPLIKEGQMLARAGVTAMMDISDGLFTSLSDLSKASSVCCMIDTASIPSFSSDSLTEKQCRELAWYGGGDFGLLFTIAPKDASLLSQLDVTFIGEIRSGLGVVGYDGVSLPIRGYSHF